VILEFRDVVAELNVFAPGENFVAELVGAEVRGCEGRDSGRDFGIHWRDPYFPFEQNTGSQQTAEGHRGMRRKSRSV